MLPIAEHKMAIPCTLSWLLVEQLLARRTQHIVLLPQFAALDNYYIVCQAERVNILGGAAMRHHFVSLLALTAVAMVGGPSLEAQHHHSPHCCSDCRHCWAGAQSGAQEVVPQASRQLPGRGPMYDPDTVTTLRGEVTAVEVVPSRRGVLGGMHISVLNGGKTTDVHIGPSWLLQRQGITLATTDRVEVTGSLINLYGRDVLIAREVKKGQTVLRLRDEWGFPIWSGGSRPPR
jgi:hypothetical protein